MSQAVLREQWEQKLVDYEASGQTIAAWCGEHKIGLGNFYYWKRRLRNNREKDRAISPISWLPLEFELKEAASERTADQINVEINGKFKVSVQKGFDHDMFRDVVNILKQE